MAITTTCPNCKARFRLAEELAGKKVRCQKCDSVFEVPVFDGSTGTPTAPASSREPAEEQAAPAAAVTIAPPAMPVAAPAPPGDEDDYDNRRRRDDDDEPQPKKKSESRRPPRRGRHCSPANAGSGMTAVILAIAGLAVFSCIICGGVGIAFVVLRDRPNPRRMTASSTPKKTTSSRKSCRRETHSPSYSRQADCFRVIIN